MIFHDLETCSELLVFDRANREVWKRSKSSIDNQHEPQLKKLPHHLEYTSLEKDFKLPPSIASNLGASVGEQVPIEEEIEDCVYGQHNHNHGGIHESLLETYCSQGEKVKATHSVEVEQVTYFETNQLMNCKRVFVGVDRNSANRLKLLKDPLVLNLINAYPNCFPRGSNTYGSNIQN